MSRAESDPRNAETLGEACANADGTFDGCRLLSWLSAAVSRDGTGVPVGEVRKIAADVGATRRRLISKPSGGAR